MKDLEELELWDSKASAAGPWAVLWGAVSTSSWDREI